MPAPPTLSGNSTALPVIESARFMRFFVRTFVFCSALLLSASGAVGQEPQERIELGKRLYMSGLRPDGSLMTGIAQENIPLTGAQAICGACHRTSAMGSVEGTEVVPALRGELLFEPLRLPTSKPPQAPILRPAYDVESLKRAIRSGINAAGETMSMAMPRYPLSDEEVDMLIAYLRSLPMTPAPGVTDREIHLATVIGESVPPATRKAMLDVFNTFIAQKNAETRHEPERSEHAPWHKAWAYESYRKWVLHVWELKGDETTWGEQLARQYRQQPVFALVGGTAAGSWRPVHEFCQKSQLPCLFPTTDLPVIAEHDFYSVYLDMGMALQGALVAQHLAGDKHPASPVIQVHKAADPLGQTAAASLQERLAQSKIPVKDLIIQSAEELPSIMAQSNGATAVLWLRRADLADFWQKLKGPAGPQRFYLSTTLAEDAPADVPDALRDRVYFVHSYELPDKLPSLLLRSTRWLQAKRIYAPEQQRIQADSYFALTMTGMALQRIRGYFIREYFIEGFEHMLDNATFTSRYPRVSLAPGQRFAAKGAYIVKTAGAGKQYLTPVTDWLIPGTE
jgi:hypothetical protein